MDKEHINGGMQGRREWGEKQVKTGLHQGLRKRQTSCNMQITWLNDVFYRKAGVSTPEQGNSWNLAMFQWPS